MKAWNGPNFQCQQMTSDGSSTPDLAECWAPTCTMDSDCSQTPDAQVCKNLNQPPATSCAVCLDGSCDCVVGQCVPAHGYIEGM
jgi:hypothetical protein